MDVMTAGVVSRTVTRVLRRKELERARVRGDLHAFLVWLMPDHGAQPPSDYAVWDRLHRDAPDWTRAGVVPPVIVDDIARIEKVLMPRSLSTDDERAAARDDLIRIVLDEFESARTPDAITREWREFRRLRIGRNRRRDDRERRVPLK